MKGNGRRKRKKQKYWSRKPSGKKAGPNSDLELEILKIIRESEQEQRGVLLAIRRQLLISRIEVRKAFEDKDEKVVLEGDGG